MNAITRDADGIATLTIGFPNAPLCGVDALAPLDAALRELDAHPARGLILRADAAQPAAPSPARPARSDEPGQQWPALMRVRDLLSRLERLGAPVAAALSGPVLSGGLSLALACHHRVALDEADARIGFPDMKYGSLPGAGGCVRLVRLLGLERALPHLLEGEALAPSDAARAGLIDALAADEAELLARAKAWILDHPGHVQPWCDRRYAIPGGTQRDAQLLRQIQQLPARLALRHRGAVPAAVKAIASAAAESLQVEFDAALLLEARYFLRTLSAPDGNPAR